MSAAGQDATCVMNSLHKPETLAKHMRRIRRVGVLDVGKEEEQSEATKRAAAMAEDFAKLNDRLIKEGWYVFKPQLYWAVIMRVTAFLVLGVRLVLHGGGKWRQEDESLSGGYDATSLACLLVGSTLLGLFFQNVAFMGHDAGHFSITGSLTYDFYIGLILGNTLTGIDLGWWKSTHNVHHSATNSVHDDPDIQHMPLLCFEERLSENRWSTYHGRFMPLLDDLLGKIMTYQHWYFYPLMAVARFNLYIQSIIYLVQSCPFIGGGDSTGKQKNEGYKVVNQHTGETRTSYPWHKGARMQWSLQAITIATFWFLVYSLLSRLDLLSAALCFVSSHIVAGMLHVQILLSHIAMHYCADGSGSTDAHTAPNGHGEAGYYEWQALSTMDVACPPCMDWFHGGLQFQLEHHLFPRLPRWNLRRLMPLTDEIFSKYDVPVVRKGFVEANCMILKQMRDVGAKVGKRKNI